MIARAVLLLLFFLDALLTLSKESGRWMQPSRVCGAADFFSTRKPVKPIRAITRPPRVCRPESTPIVVFPVAPADLPPPAVARE